MEGTALFVIAILILCTGVWVFARKRKGGSAGPASGGRPGFDPSKDVEE